MAEKKESPTSWADLRKMFPTMERAKFISMVSGLNLKEMSEEYKEILFFLLEEEEKKALEAEEASNEAIWGLHDKLSADMEHVKFSIPVPPGIDLLHFQAYIVYGLIAPAQQRTFAGGHRRNFANIHRLVRNKLGLRFSLEKFEAVEKYLIRHGVVDDSKGRSLNLNEKRATPEGQRIITEAKRFSREYLPKSRK